MIDMAQWIRMWDWSWRWDLSAGWTCLEKGKVLGQCVPDFMLDLCSRKCLKKEKKPTISLNLETGIVRMLLWLHVHIPRGLGSVTMATD